MFKNILGNKNEICFIQSRLKTFQLRILKMYNVNKKAKPASIQCFNIYC
jgi:hypothetical protein